MARKAGTKRSRYLSVVPPPEERPSLELVLCSAEQTVPIDRESEFNAIVERARRETKASAAALALESDGRVICCARAGECAPSLGAELDRDTGMSGMCLRTGEPVCCQDASSDPRVDGEAARRLGVFSILAVPLKRNGATIGLLEVFSQSPFAFGTVEEAELQHVSKEVLRVLSIEAGVGQGDWQAAVDITYVPELTADVHEGTAAGDGAVSAAVQDASEPEARGSAHEALVSDAVMSLMSDADAESAVTTNQPAKPRPRRRHLLLLAVLAVLAVAAIAVSLRAIRVERPAPSHANTIQPESNGDSALELLRRAAQRGETSAQMELATRYLNGDGVDRDDAAAVSWLQEAARRGNGDAQYELGNTYADGRGVPRDPVNAYACYVLAGANGNSASDEALRFLTPKLSDAQIAQVRLTVGDMYEQGRGTPVDYVAAYTWFTLAQSAGSADGQRARQSLASKMSRQQLDAANRRASEWLRRHSQQPR